MFDAASHPVIDSLNFVRSGLAESVVDGREEPRVRCANARVVLPKELDPESKSATKPKKMSEVEMSTDAKKPSAGQKQLAKYFASKFGGEARVVKRYDELETTTIAVLEASSGHTKDPKSFATVGLFERSNVVRDRQIDVPIEILGASFDDRMANILATLAFRKIKDEHVFCRDTVSENAIGMYNWGLSTAHVLFTDLISWELEPAILDESGQPVHFLQALPITDPEFHYVRENGCDALLQKVPIGSEDYFHLDRRSYV